jgi:hypothetical protein
MADPNINQVVASVWESVMTPDPVDNIFTSQGLIFLLNENGFKSSSDGGRLFEYTVEYAVNTTFRSYGELEVLDTTRIDVFDAARYEQKIYAGTVVFSDLEELRNAAAGRKFDIVKQKLKNGRSSALEGLNTMLYGDGTGNGGKDMDGLAKIISATPTTGTVGGINAATWAFWRNKQASGAKTSVIFDNLRAAVTSVFNQCSLGGTEKVPTGLVSDRTTFEGYEGLLVNIERLYREDAKNDGDIAFLNDAIAFKGKPWIYDENATAAQVQLVNNNYLKLSYLKGGWMKMKEPVEPANQLSRVYRVMTVGNLCASARRHLGVVTATTS